MIDISSVSNNNALIATTKINMRREEAQTGSFEAALKSAAESQDDAALMKACKDFESYFVGVMFKQMRSTVSMGSSWTEKSQTETTFQEMLDDEYSKKTAENGSFGLAKFMFKQMKRAYAAVEPLK